MTDETNRPDQEHDDVPATGPGSAESAGTTGNPSAGAGEAPEGGTYTGEGVGRREDVREVPGGGEAAG